MSRGLLRIRSARAPYRRAGLSWASKASPIEVDVRDLDGARLLSLATDQVLSVAIGTEDGSFQPLPRIGADVTATVAQGMIDALAATLPPREAKAAQETETNVEPFDRAELVARNQRQAEQIEQLNVDLSASLSRATTAESDLAAALLREKAITDERDALKAAAAAAPAAEASESAAKSTAKPKPAGAKAK